MTFIGVLYTLATLETEGMRCEVRDIFVRLDILLRPPPAGSFREGVWWREDPSLMLFRTIFARWLDEGDAVRCTGCGDFITCCHFACNSLDCRCCSKTTKRSCCTISSRRHQRLLAQLKKPLAIRTVFDELLHFSSSTLSSIHLFNTSATGDMSDKFSEIDASSPLISVTYCLHESQHPANVMTSSAAESVSVLPWSPAPPVQLLPMSEKMIQAIFETFLRMPAS